MVTCAATGGKTLGKQLKISIFTPYLTHNLQVGFWFLKSLGDRDTVVNKTYGFLNPQVARSNFHREIIYT